MCEDLRQLFNGIIPRGALAFDIGANVGTYTSALYSLGVCVIAVDANADCLRHLELMRPGHEIQLVHAAVGNTTGLATFNMSDQSDGLSAISTEWLDALNKHYQRSQKVWNRTATVPMITIDSLMAHFGAPYYVKIDIEGYDSFALDGMTTQPALLSFEFHRVCLQNALDCLDKKVIAPSSLFNIHIAGPKFLLPFWVGKDELKKTLAIFENDETYGDIYVSAPRQASGSSDNSLRIVTAA